MPGKPRKAADESLVYWRTTKVKYKGRVLSTQAIVRQNGKDSRRFTTRLWWGWPLENTKNGDIKAEVVSEPFGADALMWVDQQIAQLLGCKPDKLEFIDSKNWNTGDPMTDFASI